MIQLMLLKVIRFTDVKTSIEVQIAVIQKILSIVIRVEIVIFYLHRKDLEDVIFVLEQMILKIVVIVIM